MRIIDLSVKIRARCVNGIDHRSNKSLFESNFSRKCATKRKARDDIFPPAFDNNRFLDITAYEMEEFYTRRAYSINLCFAFLAR